MLTIVSTKGDIVDDKLREHDIYQIVKKLNGCKFIYIIPEQHFEANIDNNLVKLRNDSNFMLERIEIMWKDKSRHIIIDFTQRIFIDLVLKHNLAENKIYSFYKTNSLFLAKMFAQNYAADSIMIEVKVKNPFCMCANICECHTLFNDNNTD